MRMDILRDKISLPEVEHQISEFWDEHDIPQKSLDSSDNRPEFVMHDGPPFATGLPHYGHYLASFVKDCVARYKIGTGYRVRRTWGWDTHGLPIEFEIEKKLGLKKKQDIEDFGIANYNEECRSIVLEYDQDWRQIIKRLGRWVDFDNGYRTMDKDYMETVWWVFKELHRRGLVYQGVKIMPYSLGCRTPLSNFEADLNYRDVSDPSVYLKFHSQGKMVIGDDIVIDSWSWLVWTTTPWTLPDNQALCINPELEYSLVQVNHNEHIMLASTTIKKVLSKIEHRVVKRFMGHELLGMKYHPLFSWNPDGLYQVLVDPYVKAERGTGVVHVAPAFGEDDLRVYGVACPERSRDPPCHVDSSGLLVAPGDNVLNGVYIKEADPIIVRMLNEKGHVWSHGHETHSYPFCWRSDSPLIYRAVQCWFVEVSSLRERLIQSTMETHWTPETIRDHRFLNWLKSAKDWCVSRNRYWGTPLPIWINDGSGETVIVDSVKELEEHSGLDLSHVTDLHRHHIDDIVWSDSKGTWRRVPEVFDCWFESGSMPYIKSQSFPADFIAEGIDQTRGWFYTLTVIGTALFDRSPFKNLMVTGLILGKDGKKMSKSKRNYDDPLQMVEKYGADAIRMYMLSSPAADQMVFKSENVKIITQKIVIPLHNVLRLYTELKDSVRREQSSSDEIQENVTDIWILMRIQETMNAINRDMDTYRLDRVCNWMMELTTDLSKWYVNLNKHIYKRDHRHTSRVKNTLERALHLISRLLGPFMPHFSEYIYQVVRNDLEPISVHFTDIPSPVQMTNATVLREMRHVCEIIDLVRKVRTQKNIPFKLPVGSITVMTDHTIPEWGHPYLRTLLNVDKINVVPEKPELVKYMVVPDHRKIGQKFKRDSRHVIQYLKTMETEKIKEFMQDGHVSCDDHLTVRLDDVHIKKEFIGTYDASNDSMAVTLDLKETHETRLRHLARELISNIQKQRKRMSLIPTDKVDIYVSRSASLDELLERQDEYVLPVLEQRVEVMDVIDGGHMCDILGESISLMLIRK